MFLSLKDLIKTNKISSIFRYIIIKCKFKLSFNKSIISEIDIGVDSSSSREDLAGNMLSEELLDLPAEALLVILSTSKLILPFLLADIAFCVRLKPTKEAVPMPIVAPNLAPRGIEE